MNHLITLWMGRTFFFDNRWEGLCFLEAVVYWTFCDIYLALCVCAATIAAVWLEAKVLYGPYQLQIVI